MIGYWLAQQLDNAIPEKTFAALICRTVVDVNDPAFTHPSKFVGELYGEAEAAALASKWGWTVKADGGRVAARGAFPTTPGNCRSCPSSEQLLLSGVGLVCCGGGGIPVIRDDRGAPPGGRGGHGQGPDRGPLGRRR